MKTLKNTFATMLIALLTISCNNDDDSVATPAPAPATNTNFIRAKVDGVDYQAIGTQITTLTDASAFNFRSDAATGIGMDFSIMGTPTVGTYTLNSSNGSTVGQLRYKSPSLYTTARCAASGGTLTITARNGNTIEGTFSFTGRTLTADCSQIPKTVTEGTFKITL